MNTIIVIGFTGPSGSGKTTLAKWLVEQKIENADIHYMEGSASLTHTEEAKAYLEKQYGHKPSGHLSVIKKSMEDPNFAFDFQLLLFQGRQAKIESFIKELNTKEYDRPQIVVTDRTFLDIAAYTSLQASLEGNLDKVSQLIDTAIQNQKSHFTLTFAVKPNPTWTEDNGSRVSSPVYQNRVVWPVLNQMVHDTYADRNFQGVVGLFGWDLATRKETVLNTINQLINPKPVAEEVTPNDVEVPNPKLKKAKK